MTETLWELAVRFALISLVAVGGATVVVPALHHDTVLTMHWLDNRRFTEIVAVAQFAPGPNILLLPMIGWEVAGWRGAGVGLLAFLLPSGALALATGRILQRHGERPGFVLLRRAIRPLPVGLMLASAFILSKTAGFASAGLALAAVTAALALRWPKVNPLWWLLAAALAAPLLQRAL